MSHAPRESLAEAQAALARALLDASAPVPPGFDDAAIADARALLARKRHHDAARREQRAGADPKPRMRALGRVLAEVPDGSPSWWWRLLSALRKVTAPRRP